MIIGNNAQTTILINILMRFSMANKTLADIAVKRAECSKSSHHLIGRQPPGKRLIFTICISFCHLPVACHSIQNDVVANKSHIVLHIRNKQLNKVADKSVALPLATR